MNRAALSLAVVVTGAVASVAAASDSASAAPASRVWVNPSHKGGPMLTVAPPRPADAERPYALTGDAAQPQSEKTVRYEPLWVGSRIVGVRAVDVR